MKLEDVNTNLDGTLSLVDKTWNDAMETAALHLEHRAQVLRDANGDASDWVWPAATQLIEVAAGIRKRKRHAV